MERLQLGLLSHGRPVALELANHGRPVALELATPSYGRPVALELAKSRIISTNTDQIVKILDSIGLDKKHCDDLVVLVSECNVHHLLTKSSASRCIDVELLIHNGRNKKNLSKIILNLLWNSKMTDVRDAINGILRRETNIDEVTCKLIVSGKVVKNFNCLLGDYVLYHHYWNSKYNGNYKKKLVIDAFLSVETVKKPINCIYVEVSSPTYDFGYCIPNAKLCKKLSQHYYQNKRTNSFKGLTKNYKSLKFCLEYAPQVVRQAGIQRPAGSPTSRYPETL